MPAARPWTSARAIAQQVQDPLGKTVVVENQPGAQLLNVARGDVVVAQEMVAALQDGTLVGTFLDVFEHEPLPATSPLRGLPNVIDMPHSAGQAQGNAARVAEIFLANLARWWRGEPMIHQMAAACAVAVPAA